jgi:hypothetical protein
VPAEERYAAPAAVSPGRVIREVDEPIRAGSLLWVFTDPHRGHEVAYNRWYERDHYYAGCMIGAWNFAGSRWVATRRHKEARFPEEPDIGFARTDGSYACVYYVLDGHHDDWLEWSTPQVHQLYAADRGFNARTHYNTGTYRHEWRAYRDCNPVPVELALDHRYAGLVALFLQRRAEVEQGELDAWFDAELPAWLAGSPVASVSSWSGIPLLPTKTDFVPDDHPEIGRRTLQLHFVEGDPLEAWDRYRDLGKRLADSGLGDVVLAAPFVATVVGTDRYVDELW